MRVIGQLFISFLITVIPAFAQNQPSSNDIVLKMQHDLNLSDDQVSNITQIVERYMTESADLEKSIDDGTINPSAVDSQRQQLKEVEDQGISQYLRSDQLAQWRAIESQYQKDDTGTDETAEDASSDEDKYTNLPR